MKKTKFATIVSANYLAYARVLAKSLIAVGHDNLEVLIVDRKSDFLNELLNETGLNFRFAEDLNLDNFERLAYKYDIVEFNTALKPTFLKKIFEEGAGNVVYLDPDIAVYKRLESVISLLESTEIVLTPHAMKPVLDGLRPSDVDYLRTGTFNLGFIGLSKGADSSALLDWWESRCLGLGFNDPTFGIFVDQKWIDLVPCYFKNVAILRDAGCNVAYWNLHERRITRINENIFVNDEHLYFFHFSGVKADSPDVLSRHQTRHKLNQCPILQKLVSDYCSLLILENHNKYSCIAYSFGNLSDGNLITNEMRRALIAYPHIEESPFSSNSLFQAHIKSVGIATSKSNTSSANTMNFNSDDIRIRIINFAIRLFVRIFGISRVSQLFKYIAFVSRESNLARILLHNDFDLRHVARK